MRHATLCELVAARYAPRLIALEACHGMHPPMLIGDATMQSAWAIAATAVEALRILQERARRRGFTPWHNLAVTCSDGRVYLEMTSEASPAFVAMVINRGTDTHALGEAIALMCPGFAPYDEGADREN